ncbi:Lrp/AsnC family transcriptional regulator [Arthrobacter crystallopoietes]|uniref:Lrp/AsnC family transcriptional regulator n=1 Tax=Crystallibacter crystallopoietes TaxID=37928 RepID=UPI003D236691
MNDFEERLVRHLQQDGQASYRELAKGLNTSRATVAAHVNALPASGELRIVAAVHPRILGPNCLAHVAVELAGDPIPVLRAMESMESRVFISQTTGRYHLAGELRMPTMASVYEQTELIRALPKSRPST